MIPSEDKGIILEEKPGVILRTEGRQSDFGETFTKPVRLKSYI